MIEHDELGRVTGVVVCSVSRSRKETPATSIKGRSKGPEQPPSISRESAGFGFGRVAAKYMRLHARRPDLAFIRRPRTTRTSNEALHNLGVVDFAIPALPYHSHSPIQVPTRIR